MVGLFVMDVGLFDGDAVGISVGTPVGDCVGD